MAGGAFLAMLRVGAFLMLIWGASRISRVAGISSIVLEITTGLVFSPSIIGLMPKKYAECYDELTMNCDTQASLNKAQQHLGGCDYDAYMAKKGLPTFTGLPLARRLSDLEEEVSEEQDALSTAGVERRLASSSSKGKTKYDDYEECLTKMCELDLAHECTLTPNIFSFVGHIGVALMIFESGMHFDFDKAKECGPIACVIAVLGTFLPLAFGTLGVMVLCSKDMYPEGLAAGTALAPTSVGIALKLLNEAKQLQKRHGQIIITAAFVDDILSLVLFNTLFSIGGGSIGVMTFLPAVCGILGMIVILVFAATYSEPSVMKLLSLVPKKPDKKLSPEDEVLFLLMMVAVMVQGTAFFFAGTHLWGCFMAGMCFAKMHFAHHVWVKQTKRVTSWMIRIFFSCTVAFSIPIDELISIEAFWKGSIMGIGPCILTKVCCAFFAGETKWVIGWAMVGRAEFAYLIAQLAASSSMMSPKVFSVVIWSLLYATVFAPFLFRKVLNTYVKKEAIKEAGGTVNWDDQKEEEFKATHVLHIPDNNHLPDRWEMDKEEELEKQKTSDMITARQLSAPAVMDSVKEARPSMNEKEVTKVVTDKSITELTKEVTDIDAIAEHLAKNPEAQLPSST